MDIDSSTFLCACERTNAGKVLTGICFMRGQAPYDGCKVGWGRVGRGEFAFYLADVGHSVGIVGPEAYAITVWALLNGSMGFPFAFRSVMHTAAAAGDADAPPAPTVAFEEEQGDGEQMGSSGDGGGGGGGGATSNPLSDDLPENADPEKG